MCCVCYASGADEGCLEELACQVMLPAAQLRSYLELVEEHKTLILHGARGSGKTFLARHLAGFLRVRGGRVHTQTNKQTNKQINK